MHVSKPDVFKFTRYEAWICIFLRTSRTHAETKHLERGWKGDLRCPVAAVSVWSPRARENHTRPWKGQTVLQYDFRARVGFTRSQQPQGIANLLFTLAPDVSFQRGFLMYAKIWADLLSKKLRFSQGSTICPAKFGALKGHLSRVSTLWHSTPLQQSVVFFGPSIRW